MLSQPTLSLQACGSCGAVQYPARELCRVCLSDALHMADVRNEGRILSETKLHRSMEPVFQPHLPLRLGTVLLEAGASVITFLSPGCATGDAVAVAWADGPLGKPLLVSLKPSSAPPASLFDALGITSEAKDQDHE